MTSKKYLEQAIRLAKNMVARRAEIDMFRTVARATGAIRYDTDKVVHSVTEARFERPTIRAADLESAMVDEYRELLEDWDEVRKVIAQIEDEDVQNVLRMKYLGNVEVDVIACRLKISRRTVWRRMELGWSEVARITGYPAPARNRLPAEERHGDAKRLLREYYESEEEDERIH